MYFSSEQENLSISKSTSADVQYCIYIDIDTLISQSEFTLWAGDQSSLVSLQDNILPLVGGQLHGTIA